MGGRIIHGAAPARAASSSVDFGADMAPCGRGRAQGLCQWPDRGPMDSQRAGATPTPDLPGWYGAFRGGEPKPFANERIDLPRGVDDLQALLDHLEREVLEEPD